MSDVDVRDYLDEHFDRHRLELELKRSVKPGLTLIAGLLVALACFVYIASNVAPGLYRPTQTVRFEVESMRAVIPGVQEAKVKGIPAGAITAAELEGGRAYVTVEIDEEYGPIYSDAKARLAPNTVLEDMFLDIVDPGTEEAGLPDPEQPLPSEQTESSVNVAEVLQTFEVTERERLRGLLANLGRGVGGRGDELRSSFVKAVPFLEAVEQMSAEIARRDEMTRRLIGNVSKLTGELASRERGLRSLVSNGAATLESIASRSSALERTLAELPPTLSELEGSFSEVTGVLDDVDGALVALAPVARELPRGLAGLRDLSDAAGPAVRDLREPVRALNPLVDRLRPVSRDLRSSLRRLEPVPTRLDRITTQVVDCRYAVERFFQWTPSVLKASDARGVAPRAFVTTGIGAVPGGFKDPNVSASPSCAPGAPIAGVPGPGGSR